jgi:hypothetical protein
MSAHHEVWEELLAALRHHSLTEDDIPPDNEDFSALVKDLGFGGLKKVKLQAAYREKFSRTRTSPPPLPRLIILPSSSTPLESPLNLPTSFTPEALALFASSTLDGLLANTIPANTTPLVPKKAKTKISSSTPSSSSSSSSPTVISTPKAKAALPSTTSSQTQSKSLSTPTTTSKTAKTNSKVLQASSIRSPLASSPASVGNTPIPTSPSTQPPLSSTPRLPETPLSLVQSLTAVDTTSAPPKVSGGAAVPIGMESKWRLSATQSIAENARVIKECLLKTLEDSEQYLPELIRIALEFKTNYFRVDIKLTSYFSEELINLCLQLVRKDELAKKCGGVYCLIGALATNSLACRTLLEKGLLKIIQHHLQTVRDEEGVELLECSLWALFMVSVHGDEERILLASSGFLDDIREVMDSYKKVG